MTATYDDLLDKYHDIESTRKGTKYEILAAMVCKILDERSIVIHDIKLRGESGVKHQFDVTIEEDGKVRRILIECKDFASSGNKVNLGIVRSFESAARDVGTEEAWIISNIGFTRPACKFAESKGIDLKTIRNFQESDMKGRIQKVVIGYKIISPTNFRADIQVDQAQLQELENACKSIGIENGTRLEDKVYFLLDSEEVGFNQFIEQKISDQNLLEQFAGESTGAISKDHTLLLTPESPLHIGTKSFSNIQLQIRYDVRIDTLVNEITSHRIAELIAEGFRNNEVVIFGDQIAERKFSNTGEIN